MLVNVERNAKTCAY